MVAAGVMLGWVVGQIKTTCGCCIRGVSRKIHISTTVAFFPKSGMPQTSSTDQLVHMILQDLSEAARKPHPPVPYYAEQGTQIYEALVWTIQDLLQLASPAPLNTSQNCSLPPSALARYF
eukprot:jgi/Psemu1/33020/gm1.33020_g